MKRIVIFLVFMNFTIIGFTQKKSVEFEKVKFEVEPVKLINTESSEICPTFVNYLLYFSGIPEQLWKKKRKAKHNTAFYNIYSATYNEKGGITSKRKLVSGFGSDYHEGPLSYCKKTGELFVTVSNTNNLKTGEKQDSLNNVRLRIVIKRLIDGKWQTVEEFPYNDRKFNFGHPAISVTGDTLVFSSDIDTLSFGKSDLFMSVRQNGIWSVPRNLGDYINTTGNELFPTFLGNGILSFATNGRTIRQGGLDIYYVAFPALDEVKIFGDEINSPFDDFGMVISEGGKFGYLTSNRDGSDDIYRFNIESK